MDRNWLSMMSRVPVLMVATREGGVDRNTLHPDDRRRLLRVATREGGVDRNFTTLSSSVFNSVATREGGVDRNESIKRRRGQRRKGRHPRGWRG